MVWFSPLRNPFSRLRMRCLSRECACLSGSDGQAGLQQDPPGAAVFLAALPRFAKPAPPTPMADIVRELDSDFNGLPSKLMGVVNKPGSACKVRQSLEKTVSHSTLQPPWTSFPHCCGGALRKWAYLAAGVIDPHPMCCPE